MVYQSDCRYLPYSIHFYEFMPDYFFYGQNTKILEVRHFRMTTVTGRAKHWYWESDFEQLGSCLVTSYDSRADHAKNKQTNKQTRTFHLQVPLIALSLDSSFQSPASSPQARKALMLRACTIGYFCIRAMIALWSGDFRRIFGRCSFNDQTIFGRCELGLIFVFSLKTDGFCFQLSHVSFAS